MQHPFAFQVLMFFLLFVPLITGKISNDNKCMYNIYNTRKARKHFKDCQK